MEVKVKYFEVTILSVEGEIAVGLANLGASLGPSMHCWPQFSVCVSKREEDISCAESPNKRLCYWCSKIPAHAYVCILHASPRLNSENMCHLARSDPPRNTSRRAALRHRQRRRSDFDATASRRRRVARLCGARSGACRFAFEQVHVAV
jgi:hypothetical protein